ncbi:MAG: response regulator transcription factor [Eubacterium sp.]|nr:response regulator transcription factor [Eubacterium sp.]
MYNVIVVDDQNMSRQVFENYIENSDDYKLLYSLDNAETVDVYLAMYQVDVIIMDVVMTSGISGLDAAKKIKKTYPQVKIIIVTSMPEVSYIEKAKAYGVDSFWYKEVQGMDFMDVLDRTMKGESVYPDKAPVQEIGCAQSDDLTSTELLVLRELTTGASNQEISARLNISVNTVRSHIQHMLEKTGFDNRTELAIQARVKGVVISDNR